MIATERNNGYSLGPEQEQNRNRVKVEKSRWRHGFDKIVKMEEMKKKGRCSGNVREGEVGGVMGTKDQPKNGFLLRFEECRSREGEENRWPIKT